MPYPPVAIPTRAGTGGWACSQQVPSGDRVPYLRGGDGGPGVTLARADQEVAGAPVHALRVVAASGEREPAGNGRSWRELRTHPVVISALLTTLGAVIWIIVFPRIGTDLSAALARASWASRYPGSAYLFSWYGGMSPASYSLLAPYLFAVTGTRAAMATAAVLSSVLLTSLLVRHRIPRPGAAAVWVAVSLLTELSAGRAAFTLGIAAALGCVVVADPSRPRDRRRLAIAGLLAVLTCLLSPVAALFLGIVAVVFAFYRRWFHGALVAVAALLPLAVMALFSDGGIQPVGLNWLPTLGATVAILLLTPRDWRMVRTGAVIYGVAVILTCLVHSPVGSNVVRLGQLLIGPLLIGIGTTRKRWLLNVALVLAAAWQVGQPVLDVSHGSGPPTAALVRQLQALNADTARLEAVPLYGHWESQELASVVPLARGWERQLDVQRNPLFYNETLSPAAYHRWLQENAVRYVALSTAKPDSAGVTEAATVRAGQPWLVPVWHDAFWQLYRFTDAEPLATPPAAVVRTTPAEITLQMSRAGTTVVRVYWSPHLRVAGAQLAQDGLWTSITAGTPGIFVLSAPY